MKMLVANVGSSSFKCQLLEMPSETVLAKAKVERIGESASPVEWTDRNGKRCAETPHLSDAVSAIRFVLKAFTDSDNGTLASLDQLDAVAFKPLCAAGHITGAQYMTDAVLEAMEEFSDYIAPMHNRACIDAVTAFHEVLPETPKVGLFETFFFQNWPEYARIYSIPWDWTQKYDVRRSMGHGCSHYYVNRRVAELTNQQPEDFNVIQMHLGGSSSLTAINAGESIDGSGAFTMQSGPPMSIRSSDMDGFLISYLWSKGEGSPKEIVDRMMTEAGLASMSGIGFDIRDLLKAEKNGNERAKLALDSYVYQIRKYLGSYMLLQGHTDIITFTGGTGEGSSEIRARILAGMEGLGVRLDPERNKKCVCREGLISADDSRVQIWVVPVNEEIVVARECAKLLGVN